MVIYWRVDAVGEAHVHRGATWQFETLPEGVEPSQSAPWNMATGALPPLGSATTHSADEAAARDAAAESLNPIHAAVRADQTASRADAAAAALLPAGN